MRKNILKYGVGLNDAGYTVKRNKKGSQPRWECPFYAKWHLMLMRCYCKKFLDKHPSYQGCRVCKEWLTFSNFKSWMEKQDWEGKVIDKDLITPGSRVYSPENCVFIDENLNKFIVGKIGVHWNRSNQKFRACCRNPFSDKKNTQEYLGYFNTEEEAFNAWFSRKREHAKAWLELVDNKAVRAALVERFNL